MLFWSALLAGAIATGPGGPEPKVTIKTDSARHEVLITAGPFDLPNMPKMESHSMMDMGMSHDTPVEHFNWPVDGWFRGYRVSLADAQGHEVPRHVMHHMIMVNFGRRQLLYPAAERLMGSGTETDSEISVPKTIGVPMSSGMPLGMYVAWHNDTGRDLNGVYLKIAMLWTPTNQNPKPVNSLPIYMDVNLTVGGSNTFDVPPGRSEKAYEFTLPVGGRLLGVGGHMHDYGVRVQLQDAVSGKVIATVKAKREEDGKLEGMSRKLYGVTGDGLELKAGHRYRVVGEYDNPTKATLKKGAMAHMVGLFVPNDMGQWPSINPKDPVYQRDLASLQMRGGTRPMKGIEHQVADHQHGGNSH